MRAEKVGEGHARSVAKAICWRITGTLDTILIAWLVTGEVAAAISLGCCEVVTKMVLYYVHERVWLCCGIGRVAGHDGQVRSAAKAVSWRITGTLDTIVLAWLITGEAALAVSIGSIEVVTKIVLFYLHERFWERMRFGLAADHPSLMSKEMVG